MSSRNTPSSSGRPSEALGEKMKRKANNAGQSAGLCCFKMAENTQIALLENQVAARQKKFGVDYLTLADRNAPESHLKKCIKDARDDIYKIREEIDDRFDKIDGKTLEVQQTMKAGPGQPSITLESAVPPSPRKSKTNLNNVNKSPNRSPRPLSKKNGQKTSSGRNLSTSSGLGNKSPRTNKKKPVTSVGGPLAVSGSSPRTSKTKIGKNNSGSMRGNGISNGTRNSKTSPKNSPGKFVVGRSGTKSAPPSNGDKKNKKSAGTSKANVPEEYRDADPSNWKCKEYKFAGAAKYEEKGKEETVKGPLAKGLKNFKANPGKYTAMAYQSDMKDWPEKDQQYLLLHREGTIKWRPQGVSPSGWMTVHVNEYERLLPFKDDILPKKFRDKYTDNMTFNGKKLHSTKNKPIMPGRGMGCGDSPGLKIIGDVDPSDIFQGSVGDCWLLSGISSVAEFDGAIKNLFRKTPSLHKMPMDKGTVATGNMYTVTLWDLATFREVDIVIDERLPAHYNGSGMVLAGKPSDDGELWACYLEKALAVHCGGWDKLVGGQCTHAWALLTGCREQYTMRRNPATGKWRCFAKCNPKTKVWLELANSPHDCAKTTYRVDWPEVGGGGSRDIELDDEEMFMRLFAWDQINYIVGAGTAGTSDKNSTAGMVDNHAYSVIETVDNVAGTDIDLIKVRNPWGSGEIEDGEFDDDGPGWDKYPQIKKALNPVVADDGIFWVTKKEFFQFFETIYLSASNMTEFLED
mmetsp:Transcript_7251/g.17726  ORF Transcript_7251/g.17726 Transcript_7251/m.17726 type:complete len:745 (+) Transcript_7251:177-2411(+)|eukprot:CAMPEP_0116106132 /NCGR_PEP_ID=MMETSP0327-20121206/15461_1 /TAXON_ID=44447 /ORGANISM="Pseudo-nitzschia delicatissima, Strain B596" /LENGTH=744 /DNA_ID=CAMNT_0003598701 /DNA_START=90 /DNA_END=2324 /DNA_ORIENTATION=+